VPDNCPAFNPPLIEPLTVRFPVILAEPETSNSYAGDIVLIPTLPVSPVTTNILPIPLSVHTFQNDPEYVD